MAAAPDPGVFVKGIADDLHRAMSTFARMDAVLITAVNGGVAAGAGFSLASRAIWCWPPNRHRSRWPTPRRA